MAQTTSLPRLNRIDFYRLTEDELLVALSQAILEHGDDPLAGDLTSDHEAILAWGRLAVDVPNGGFTQFFYNHGGDRGVAPLANLLESLGAPKASDALCQAVAIYRQHAPAFLVGNPWDGLFGSIKEFDKHDRAFEKVLLQSNRALAKWTRSHIAELATGEDGEPIDPQFTGSIESNQPNGLVGRHLEVKNGKPHGAYREFFDDGTVRSVVFYKSGKTSGDFWPDGKLKRKESKRGGHVIIEWYYPSGWLQKRLVQDKGGYIVEPVRLFHENGQLAEEIATVEGRKLGPWLKFFEDGLPHLQAEYGPDETLIVHNAWDNDRKQVVKDGTGIFKNDGREIDIAYSVFRECLVSDKRELKGGIPHGKMTAYFNHVLFRISLYKNGVEHGESTKYWDNGRIRSVTNFCEGIAGSAESFPKFDRPVPAVVLELDANEKLYAAWKHASVDEYPQVLNLGEVQSQLSVPDFLREVHERNLAGAIKSDYEDCNTFKDFIAYFLTVNDVGEVTGAAATGSGIYSGWCWNAYPAFLLKLRFAPGRIRGRAIECRVAVRVVHTFIEGGSR